MRVLVVEDDVHKLASLVECLRGQEGWVVSSAVSYHSGRRTLLADPPDVVVLDMTLPTFDPSPEESGGRAREFGGWELMDEIRANCLATRMVVVTGFEAFGTGEERMTRDELTRELRKRFGADFMGMIYYRPAQADWRDQLLELLRGAAGT